MESINGFFGEWRFLSNFWYVPGGVFGYPTNEHFFQAMKNKDKAYRQRVKAMRHPAEAKKAGRLIELRDDWSAIQLQVMYTGVKDKFKPGTELAAKLLATGDAHLEETNNWKDRYWGVYQGEGQNHLGKILMRVRQELREEG